MNEPTRSGQKFRTREGIVAIKDGIKAKANADAKVGRKPPWLRVRIGGGAAYEAVKNTVREHQLATVCEESHCPNIGECWNHGTATIMLMGAVCTRACRFCAVDTGNPNGWLDPHEPANAAQSVRLMGLRYETLGRASYILVIRGVLIRIECVLSGRSRFIREVNSFLSVYWHPSGKRVRRLEP